MWVLPAGSCQVTWSWKLARCYQSGGLVSKNPGQICLQVVGTPLWWGAAVMVCSSVRPQNEICCKTRGDHISLHKDMWHWCVGRRTVRIFTKTLLVQNKKREIREEPSAFEERVQEPLGAHAHSQHHHTPSRSVRGREPTHAQTIQQ